MLACVHLCVCERAGHVLHRTHWLPTLVLCGYLWQLGKAQTVQVPFTLRVLVPNCYLTGPTFEEGGFLCCKATQKFSGPFSLLSVFFCLEHDRSSNNQFVIFICSYGQIFFPLVAVVPGVCTHTASWLLYPRKDFAVFKLNYKFPVFYSIRLKCFSPLDCFSLERCCFSEAWKVFPHFLLWLLL